MADTLRTRFCGAPAGNEGQENGGEGWWAYPFLRDEAGEGRRFTSVRTNFCEGGVPVSSGDPYPFLRTSTRLGDTRIRFWLVRATSTIKTGE